MWDGPCAGESVCRVVVPENCCMTRSLVDGLNGDVRRLENLRRYDFLGTGGSVWWSQLSCSSLFAVVNGYTWFVVVLYLNKRVHSNHLRMIDMYEPWGLLLQNEKASSRMRRWCGTWAKGISWSRRVRLNPYWRAQSFKIINGCGSGHMWCCSNKFLGTGELVSMFAVGRSCRRPYEMSYWRWQVIESSIAVVTAVCGVENRVPKNISFFSCWRLAIPVTTGKRGMNKKGRGRWVDNAPFLAGSSSNDPGH